MIQLRPFEKVPINRQLDDPADTATYYIQAVVRNALTNATIDTINLSDQGTQRFTGSFTAPADTSGTGFYLDITTTVYTDSGYTTKSDNYGIERRDYLVATRWSYAFGGKGGGGDIDYKKLRRIFREELDKTEFPDVNFFEFVKAVDRAVGAIKFPEFPEIKFPEQKVVDLKPVLSEIMSLQDRMKNLPADLKPASKEIADLAEKMSSERERILTMMVNLLTGLDKKMANEELKKVVRESTESAQNKETTQVILKLTEALADKKRAKEEDLADMGTDQLMKRAKKLLAKV